MSLEERVSAIEARNQRVEADKAWEVSTTRKVMIVTVTYLTMLLLMASIGVDRPFISALIPTTGFFLSTLSLSFIKQQWLSRRR
ncbi:hypothetical protein A2631_05150 [Candidatus Daviesbacteria bacterium RIFCSPHIGHO2_01_FULL_44_29]|uniref:Uncharacterized protein n=1 Tax=Candidatus Daviesbacteria bacterium RIFCSPHIGHO2_02_FULL_43_12 TaxID=1797776 RepID=A0A1F5KGN6_9BACT|nr:MAG: hypothetical protein A2631_05150 [Candidatus Daviesbacteria bacterium RIFCSPHIGHO2_01_FULL_44_29]OGE40106.1 MAG: hypothetical protein A3D25_04870 [Candidatus Daviesbacteria bacterium RIFCSPHIGHO2_02_FULL_43_12]OGE41055.1 MAG: hypothetical protein A3E86_04975 [Candidatus Daviesbacteria bacterium RIFCSPHIGHO2_12_FULL_47_45]OGE70212.1 MAG: hypothetical protein A3B55_00690 [Candidatus Daviesbacteria bacterium RIFCSPLOWO2_01_FULL_43_15]